MVNFTAVNNELGKINWDVVLVDSSVNDKWLGFKTLIKKVVSKHTLEYKVKKSATKPWINSRILKMIKEKRRLWKTFKRTHDPSDYIIHRAFSNTLSTIRFQRGLAESRYPRR